MYVDNFILYSESEKDVKVMVWHFIEVYRKSLKVSVDKSEVKGVDRKEGSVCEVYIDGA